MIENILKNLIEHNSNIWYGICIAVIIVVLLYGIIAFVNNNKKFSILSFAIGLVVLPFLSFQMSRLCGAIETRNSLDNVSDIASSVKETISDATGVSEEDAKDAVSFVSEFVPGVSNFVDSVSNSVSSFSEAMMEQAYTYLNWYIVRRCAWSLGFIILAIIGILYTMNSGSNGYRRTSARYERTTSRRSDERRPSSRRYRR